jgi:hypothetical protein
MDKKGGRSARVNESKEAAQERERVQAEGKLGWIRKIMEEAKV